MNLDSGLPVPDMPSFSSSNRCITTSHSSSSIAARYFMISASSFQWLYSALPISQRSWMPRSSWILATSPSACCSFQWAESSWICAFITAALYSAREFGWELSVECTTWWAHFQSSLRDCSFRKLITTRLYSQFRCMIIKSNNKPDLKMIFVRKLLQAVEIVALVIVKSLEVCICETELSLEGFQLNQ